MAASISKEALAQIFLDARTQNKWLDKDIPDTLLRDLIDIMKMGPTSANCSPARIVFVKSQAAKQRLLPHLSSANRDKTNAAPVTAIIGHDLNFYDQLPRLYPHADAKSWFTSSEALANETAFRNGTLQGAYFIIAARALGLDTGPMSGFNNAAVDQEFFSGTTVKSNFICSLGYGDPAGVFPRLPRFTFEEMASIL